MKKERNQDLVGPEDESVEQHVKEMMDVTIPDEPSDPTSNKTSTKPTKKSVAINVVDHNEEPPKTDPKIAAAIEEANEQLAEQATTAPLLGAVTKEPAKPKQVKVTHSDDEEVPVDIEAVETEQPEKIVVEEPPVSEPNEAVITVGELMDESPLEDTLESSATDKAVTEIIAAESDELLEVQDAKTKPAAILPPKPKTVKKGRLRAFLRNSAVRWAMFLLLFGAIVVAGVMPASRYYVLNKAGVRSSASLLVIDQSTLQPLKNAKVSLAGQNAVTDADGRAELDKLLLGPTEITVEKRAFAETRQKVTIGWGSNPLADVGLKPTGSQYTFVVTDVFSGNPITNVEATAGDANATANEKGEVTLTLEKIDTPKTTVIFKAEGYRSEEAELDLEIKEPINLVLTPAHKVAFVSKRTGSYGVYKIDADGKNEALVLAGTGSETNEITLATHQIANVAMLVSTREGKRQAGTLLQSLTFINLDTNATKNVSESVQIQIVGWLGSRLVYTQQAKDAGADDPQRSRLMSYDYISGDNRQLAVANYFNDIIVAGGKIYFAPSSAFQNGVNLGVFQAHADGSGKQAILNKESWSMYRTAHDRITLAVEQDWYDYIVGQNSPTKLEGQPSNTASRAYADSPDGKHSVWIDDRDGRGTILVYNTATKTEAVLYATNGLKEPVRWLNDNTIVYRVSTNQETADYVISISSKSPKKIVDVTNTAGFNR